jgi:hypothetical protein
MRQIPIITTVYIPSPSRERYRNTSDLVKRCVAAGIGPRLLAIDKAPEEFRLWAGGAGHRLVTLEAGKPPRMTRLLQEALALVPEGSEWVWTVEQDALLDESVAAKMESIMAGLPLEVASLTARPVDEDGRDVAPHIFGSWTEKSIAGHYLGRGELLRIPFAPFLATLWRLAALRNMDWSHVPPFVCADQVLGRTLKTQGLVLLGHAELKVLHYPRSSYLSNRMAGKD